MREEINLLDRVIIPNDLQSLHGGNKITAGTIGTVRQFIAQNEVMLLIQYDSDLEEPKFVGVPINFVKKVNLEDLKLVRNPQSITPKLYRVGNQFLFKVTQGDVIGTIESIDLMQNEADDEITISFKGSENETFSRSIMESISSYIPFEMPQFPDDITTSNPVINHPIITEEGQLIQNDKVKLDGVYNNQSVEENKTVNASEDILKLMLDQTDLESIDDEPILISVGKFKFKFIDNTLTSEGLEKLNLKEIKQLQRVFTLLEKLF